MDRSHPSRVRGLKFISGIILYEFLFVAPFAGAWIEIQESIDDADVDLVAPFAGAWIEIISVFLIMKQESSHPSRVRGLKLVP